MTSGYVYVIQAIAGGPVKIGFSENPERRLSQIQGAHHTKLTIVDQFRGSREIEERLHYALADHRLSGEWFTDHPAVWEAIKLCARNVGASARRQPFAREGRRSIVIPIIGEALNDLDGVPFDEDVFADRLAQAGRDIARQLAEAQAA